MPCLPCRLVERSPATGQGGGVGLDRLRVVLLDGGIQLRHLPEELHPHLVVHQRDQATHPPHRLHLGGHPIERIQMPLNVRLPSRVFLQGFEELG